MKKPSLALIPSGYKAGKVYSILPNNGVGDFTFSRNSVATRVNKDGLIEEVAINTPRLDYSDGGCPSLLLEPSRTNLFTHSSEVNEANTSDFVTGTGITPTVLSDDELAPDGSLTAREWNFNVGSGTSSSDIAVINKSYATTIGLDYTMSVYLYSSVDNAQIYIRAAGSVYTLRTLSLGWNRVEVTGEATSTSSSWLIGLRQGLSGGTINSNVTVKVWGLQVEEGANATSYIPTNGSIATKVNDLCVDSMLDSPIITSNDWTLFFDLDGSDVRGVNKRISLSDGTNTNRVLLSYNANNQVYLFQTYNSGVATNNKTLSVSERAKIALVSTADGYDLYHNGNFISSQTDGRFDASSINRISFVEGGNSLQFEGKVYGLRYYDEAITSQEAIELTTL